MFSTKGTHQVQIFRLSTARMKSNKIPCHFSSHKSVFTYIWHHLSVSSKITPLYFFISSLYTLYKKSPSRWDFQTFDWVKIYQIPHVMFETASQFFFKLCITVQYHQRCLVYIILAQTLHTFDKNIPSKGTFSDFSLKLKFIKFLMSFFKQKVNFSLNLESLFSVMRDNSSVLFLVKTVHDLDKRSSSKCKILDFRLLT